MHSYIEADPRALPSQANALECEVSHLSVQFLQQVRPKWLREEGSSEAALATGAP